MEIDGKINQANGRLKSGNIPVRIERTGKKLRLRATLPPKPTSDRHEPYQQRISLGIPTTGAGLKQAEAEARKLAGEMATRSFEWSNYFKEKDAPIKTWAESIEQFKAHLLRRGTSIETWDGDYGKIFKKLPPGDPMSVEAIGQLLDEIPSDSRTHKRAKTVLKSICRFVGLEFDFGDYVNRYQPEPRDIPSDGEIAQLWNELPPQWRWPYGMMATYGLRNHEIFHVSLTDFPIASVGKSTKTGSRQIFPLFPEWAELWNLEKPMMPPCPPNTTNSERGRIITLGLGKLLPFKPYDLRHAWAIRSIQFGLPVEIASAQMGHTCAIHTRTYHRWITRSHYRQLYEMMMSRPDRPKPPIQ